MLILKACYLCVCVRAFVHTTCWHFFLTTSFVSHRDVEDCVSAADLLYLASVRSHMYSFCTVCVCVCVCSVVQMEVLIECWCAGRSLGLGENEKIRQRKGGK